MDISILIQFFFRKPTCRVSRPYKVQEGGDTAGAEQCAWGGGWRGDSAWGGGGVRPPTTSAGVHGAVRCYRVDSTLVRVVRRWKLGSYQNQVQQYCFGQFLVNLCQKICHLQRIPL